MNNLALTSAQITITDLHDGKPGDKGIDAIVVVLDSDSHQIPTDMYGNNENYIGAETNVSVIVGGKIATGWNMSVEVSTTNGVPDIIGVQTGFHYKVTKLHTTTGTVTFVLSKSGEQTQRKQFKLTKSMQGVSATSYRLDISDTALVKNRETKTYTPGFVTLIGMAKTGDESARRHAGWFKIYEQAEEAYSVDEYQAALAAGQVMEDKEYIVSDIAFPYILSYQSLAAEDELVYTPKRNIRAIHIDFYLDAAMTVILDRETIPVVANGQDTILLNVWCPEGDKIRNQAGSLTIQADLFQGVEARTPESIQWYHMEPLAAGDSDAGAGWKKIIASNANGVTGYTTSKLTVPGGAVAGNETYKVVAKWKEHTLSGTATIADVSDPILCFLDGVNTFKNGKGTTSIRCRLMRDNEELDKDGTEYTYTWSLYDRNFKKLTFSQTGKTVTISATSVESLANLTCDVHKI